MTSDSIERVSALYRHGYTLILIYWYIDVLIVLIYCHSLVPSYLLLLSSSFPPTLPLSIPTSTVTSSRSPSSTYPPHPPFSPPFPPSPNPLSSPTHSLTPYPSPTPRPLSLSRWAKCSALFALMRTNSYRTLSSTGWTKWSQKHPLPPISQKGTILPRLYTHQVHSCVC